MPGRVIMPELLRQLESRKAAKIDPCESCYATGLYEGRLCSDCLGQGVLLTREEYIWLLSLADVRVSALHDDSVLNADTID